MKQLVIAAIIVSAAACGGVTRAADDPGQAPANPMLAQVEKLAGLGGAVEAAVKACGFDDNTAEAKRQQQEQFVRMGGSQQQFEAAYQAGHDQAMDKYDAAAPAERKRMCDEFREFGASASRAG